MTIHGYSGKDLDDAIASGHVAAPEPEQEQEYDYRYEQESQEQEQDGGMKPAEPFPPVE